MDDNKIFVLKNFVEDYLFDKNIQKDFSKLKIIYLSNLMAEKGILDLLEALQSLKNNNIEFKAKIAGNIDKNLQDKIDIYFNKLADNIEYLGVVSGIEKKQMLEWGNIFVFPTYYKMEGQPIALFEAMATGNIILTTSHAGIPDIFKQGNNGFYIDKKSPVSIATKLEEINGKLEEFKLLSENNRKEAEKSLTVQIFIDNLYKILIKD
jgi:glycosyltransferase involved in cell wall biosynthesis